MALFGLFGNKNTKSVTPQEMIECAKDLENCNRTIWSDGMNGEARDFPQCNDRDAKGWEIAFVINLNKEQSIQIKRMAQITVEVGMMAMNVDEVVLPVILFKLNGDESLSFACITRYDMLSESPVLHSLNYFDILLSQEKIKLSVMFQGEQGSTLSVTNRIKLSPYSFQIKDNVNRVINSLPRKNGQYDTMRVWDARFKLEMAIKNKMISSNDKSYGELFWEKYESGN